MAAMRPYMSFLVSLGEMPFAISGVTTSVPRASDCRLRMAALMSPDALATMLAMASSSTSTPSELAMARRTFAAVAADAFLNVICRVSFFITGLFLLSS